MPRLTALILCAALALSGCASVSWRTAAYTATAADLGTTAYAIEVDGRFSEGNPLTDEWAVIAGVNALLYWLLHDRVPENHWLWKLSTGTHAAAATWNASQLGK